MSASELVEVNPHDVERINQALVVSGDSTDTPFVSPSSIIDANVANSPFAGVVSINPVGDGFSSICSGTLISSTHVLSAAHCFDSNDNGQLDADPDQSRVIFNNNSSPFAVDIDSIVIHQDYTGFNRPGINDDLAIVTLAQAAPDNIPIYELNRDSFTSPERIVIAGFGRSGTGTEGFTEGASFTTRRFGENVAAGFILDDEGSGRREGFVFDFDGPNGATNSLGDGRTLGNDIEVTIGGGDSGGPSFLFDDRNNNGQIEANELRLFGVNTFGTSLFNAPAPFFGSQGGGIVVSSYLDFIDNNIESPQSTFQNIGLADTITVTDSFRRVNFGRSFVNPVVVAGPLSTQGGEAATVRIRNVDSTGFEIRIQEYDYLDRIHVNEQVSVIVVEAGVHELPDGTILQAGNLDDVNHNSSRTRFTESFSRRPLVLTQATSKNGSSAITPRLESVNRNGFNLQLQEEEANNGIHAFESASYIAIERGRSNSQNATFDAQFTTANVSDANSTLDFRIDFDSAPAFFANIQTTAGRDTAGLRYRQLRNESATVFVQEEQSADAEVRHSNERVGFLAIESGLLRGRTLNSIPANQNSAALAATVDQAIDGFDLSELVALADSIDVTVESVLAKLPIQIESDSVHEREMKLTADVHDEPGVFDTDSADRTFERIASSGTIDLGLGHWFDDSPEDTAV